MNPPQIFHRKSESPERKKMPESDDRIHGQAQRSVNELIRLAERGDEMSIILLFMIAAQTVTAVNSGVKQRPDLFLKFSRDLFAWPAFISPKRAIRLANAKLLQTLQLGKGNVYSDKGWQPSAPSTQSALGLFLTAQVHKEKWGLPPLTKKNKRIWFEKSWNHFLSQGIVPEQTPKLARLGKSAIGKKSVSRGMSVQTEGMKRDDVRAEIKRQVWNAFDRLIAGLKSK
jgi:hypothetical protein